MEKVAANAIAACGRRVGEVRGDPVQSLPYEIVAGSFRFSQRLLELKRREPLYREALGHITPDALIFEATAYYQAMLFSFMASAPEDKEEYLIQAFVHARAEVSAMLGAMCNYPVELFAERSRKYPATIPGGVERFFQAVAAARGRTAPAPNADVCSERIPELPIPASAFYKEVAKPLLDPVFKAMVTAANAI
jgi:hypothetical protein